MNIKAAILVLSDKASAGEREDLSGPVLRQWLTQHQVDVVRCQVIPDDYKTIVMSLREWTDCESFPLILTCGGTGVSPRDVTPDATMQVIDRVLPGFGEQMRAESLKITPMAILSRAIAGMRNKSLIINLPGSPNGAIENLEAVWPAVFHAIAKIGGDTTDCAGLGRY